MRRGPRWGENLDALHVGDEDAFDHFALFRLHPEGADDVVDHPLIALVFGAVPAVREQLLRRPVRHGDAQGVLQGVAEMRSSV